MIVFTGKEVVSQNLRQILLNLQAGWGIAGRNPVDQPIDSFLLSLGLCGGVTHSTI